MPAIPNVGRFTSASGGRLNPRNELGQFRERSGQGGMLLWYGREIVEEIIAEAVIAVRETTEAAAQYARDNHPWSNITYALEEGIHAQEPIVVGSWIRGRWGAPSPALFLELGTYRSSPFPFLRPAADAVYGDLGGRLEMR
jgi:hypothetical protein